MGPYNGFSPTCRKTQGAILTAKIANGDWPKPDHCAVCGRTPAAETPPGRLQQHSEDYGNPDRYVGICHRCHSRLHKRFDRPKNWTDLLVEIDASSHDLPAWVRALALTPVDSPPGGSPPSQLAGSSSALHR